MPNATYELRADFTRNGSYADANEDLTPYVLDISYSRGKDFASQLTGRAVPGRMTVKLHNPDGRFNRYNTASPLYGLLDAGARIRLTTTAPAAYTLWSGYLDTVQPDVQVGGLPTATLSAYGVLGWLAGRKVDHVVFGAPLTTGLAVTLAIDYIMTSSGLDTGQTTINDWWSNDEEILSALRKIEATELGYIGEDANGTLIFEDRAHRLVAPHTVSQATWTDALSGTISYDGIVLADERRGIYNHASVKVQLYDDATATGVLWSHPEAGSSNLYIEPGATNEYWAVYPTATAPQNADHVFFWDAPTTGVGIIANEMPTGTATNLTNAISITDTSDTANKYHISLANTGARRVYLTTFAIGGLGSLRRTEIAKIHSDTGSEALYGSRTYPHNPAWLPSDLVADDWVHGVINLSKDPRPILQVALLANRNSTQLDEVLKRQISDRITLVADRTTIGGTNLGINGDFFVENMSHHIDRHGVHRAVFDLSLCSQTEMWVLDTSKLGIGTRLAF